VTSTRNCWKPQKNSTSLIDDDARIRSLEDQSTETFHTEIKPGLTSAGGSSGVLSGSAAKSEVEAWKPSDVISIGARFERLWIILLRWRVDETPSKIPSD
jgi:hypothetical protein